MIMGNIKEALTPAAIENLARIALLIVERVPTLSRIVLTPVQIADAQSAYEASKHLLSGDSRSAMASGWLADHHYQLEGAEPCKHSTVERDGDLLVWRCAECGEVAPWSADARLGRSREEGEPRR